MATNLNPDAFKNKTVLVTGATGFTGRVLVRKLIERGARVRAIARESSDCSIFSEMPIEWYRGEVYESQVVHQAAEKVDYVFHVAAAFRQAKVVESEYEKVHVESTKLIAQRVIETGGCLRFVHVSTMGVHGHIENPPGDENSPFAPGDTYQRTKLEAELWFREFAEKNNLPFTIIRPTAIYGPGDRRLFKIFKMASFRLFPILGSGKCLYHLIHVEDLCEAMLTAAEHPAALAETFIVGDKTAISLERMAKIIADEYGRKLWVLRIPAAPFFLAADICEKICRPLGIEPPLYRRRVAFYTKDRSFSTEKLRKLLSFTPKFDTEEGLRTTAEWYVENGWLNICKKPSSKDITRNDDQNQYRFRANS